MSTTVKQILNEKNPTLSFEIFPPKKEADFENVANVAKDLSSLKPDFISITYGAGGGTKQTSARVSKSVEDAGCLALSHLTCVGQKKEDLLLAIESLKKNNIKNVMALRGDLTPTCNTTIEGFLHASDLIAYLKKYDFCVGGACYPEGHPESKNRQKDLDNLQFKVAAGVDFLTTQMFFDNDIFYTFLYNLSRKHIDVPVIAGIMPVTSPKQIEKMITLSNAFVPKRLLSICDKYQDNKEAFFQAGIAYATEQIIDLICNGVRGIHIYTMNKPQVAKTIMRNIDHIL